MREVAVLVVLLPILLALDPTLWTVAPERRVMRSAIAAGFVVGRVTAGAAW